MENATKALLIAAGILVAIILISLGFRIFGNSSKNIESAEKAGGSISDVTSKASLEFKLQSPIITIPNIDAMAIKDNSIVLEKVGDKLSYGKDYILHYDIDYIISNGIVDENQASSFEISKLKGGFYFGYLLSTSGDLRKNSLNKNVQHVEVNIPFKLSSEDTPKKNAIFFRKFEYFANNSRYLPADDSSIKITNIKIIEK